MNKPRLIFSSDLALTGQDPRSLAKLCKKGVLKRVRQGIYVKASEWALLTPAGKYGLQADAFRHLARTEPVYCHLTAGLLWGLWIVGTPEELMVRTEVTTGGQSRNGVRRKIGAPTDRVLRCGQFLITDKLTTTIALISKFAFPAAVAVCDSSLRPKNPRGQVNTFVPASQESTAVAVWEMDEPQGDPLTKDLLLAAAQQLPSQAARDRTIAVINFSSPLSGSAGESLSRAKMFQLGFPTPVLQKEYRLRDGRNAAVDFWFEELNLAGEFDGKAKYLRQDWSGGSMEERLWKEKQREDDIRSQGVRFVRWTWRVASDKNLLEQVLRQAGLPQKTNHRRK
ncbi:hypothetical protein JOF48_002777 [Arthrobacter stackebrandtii]|uniref:Transcriptional regulator, AbiEi antitoxin, Type IV TA system n=1 Tax=Arthrobacter stackebrandtii TaxID=272161 RepID=A0ABS4YYW1_9MICC|nr:type IV toxin-antitoxin system AbiEi family antitoxin domain-containing protein [Arthrobacter stackebrandtii]MBP2413978.1 hypothetical protein [Arthrobacter stackebrandtii]